ncbi:MAG: DsbA family oxidoreductase [Myxococcota bacterium]
MNSPEIGRLTLEIVSDTICPWCYIGKRHLDEALTIIGSDVDLAVRWRPLELNPDMPREGLERRVYRSRKFGSWERSMQLDAEVQQAGHRVGLDFQHERMRMTPNTLASHVLIRHAEHEGLQHKVIEAVFRAYFSEGKDIGDPQVLADVAATCGLDRANAEAALNDENVRTDVRNEARAFASAGVRSVPTILLNRYRILEGAPSADSIVETLTRAAADPRVRSAGQSESAHV